MRVFGVCGVIDGSVIREPGPRPVHAAPPRPLFSRTVAAEVGSLSVRYEPPSLIFSELIFSGVGLRPWGQAAVVQTNSSSYI